MCSEVLAAESVTCLNVALHHLKDIWEEIGISEEQRLQRTNVVKNHIKVTVLGVKCTKMHVSALCCISSTGSTVLFGIRIACF